MIYATISDARKEQLLSELADFDKDDLRALCISLKVENEALVRKAEGAVLDAARIRQIDVKHQIPLGFKIEKLASGATTIVASRPQTVFRPVRLAVDPECARFFEIHDFRIGNNSYLLSGNSWPATCFPPIEADDPDFKAKAKQLRLDIGLVQIAQDLSITIRNLSEAPRNFRALIWGYDLAGVL